MNYACVEHEFKTFEFYNWHHVCLTYDHRSLPDGSNKILMGLYVDGTLKEEGEKMENWSDTKISSLKVFKESSSQEGFKNHMIGS